MRTILEVAIVLLAVSVLFLLGSGKVNATCVARPMRLTLFRVVVGVIAIVAFVLVTHYV
jgi:hypothetical protein